MSGDGWLQRRILRRDARPPQREAAQATDGWVALFSAACKRSVADASAFEESIQLIQNSWRERIGKVRRNSAIELLISSLPGAPVVTVTNASKLIGRTYQATNEAIDKLCVVGVLSQVKVGRRNRAFEAKDVIDAFVDLERELASPEGDTRTSDPSRPVPGRRQK